MQRTNAHAAARGVTGDSAVRVASRVSEMSLTLDHDTRSQVSPDGQQTWFWRKTISGCVLGVGLAAKNRGFLEWLYSGAEPPTAGPLDAPDVWGQVFDTPPDWQV
jgi:hypothetical protein